MVQRNFITKLSEKTKKHFFDHEVVKLFFRIIIYHRLRHKLEELLIVECSSFLFKGNMLMRIVS